jgi:hypothetical protein
MKKLLLLLILAALIPCVAFPQTLADVTKAIKGDTLVIKDYSDYGSKANSLYIAMLADSVTVPAGRVYELMANGFFPLANNPTSSPSRTTVIVGSDARMLVANGDAGSAPPLITGNVGSSVNQGGISAGGNLTIKNCNLVPASNDGGLAWAYTGTSASNLKLLFDNCLMERTRWIFVVTGNNNCDLTFRNCYFVNMNGQPCRRNGGVLDDFNPQDSLVVENCTHIMAQGSMYKFRDHVYNRIIINHNTFINCAGYIFMDLGYQSNSSYTNNIFINCNIQGYPSMQSIDTGEQDLDWIPMGLVNVYPDSVSVATGVHRKFLVQDNLAYWHSYLNDMITTLNTTHVNSVTNWKSQMIVSNARTDSMFKHIGRFTGTAYTYLNMDTWKNQLPTFTDSKNLFTTTSGGALNALKTFALATVDTGPAGAALLPDWRLVNIGPSYYVYSDWPIPVNLAYSDAALLTAGLGKLPLGDLNWFPTQKAAWAAQRTAELTKIQTAMDNHTLVVDGIADHATLPGTYQLEQNYPNPFNPSTKIDFTIPTSGPVQVKVYNVLGEEVATIVNETLAVGKHSVTFDASRLASGVYLYKITAGSFVNTKKMVLLK